MKHIIHHLAKNVHDIWAVGRLKEGWIYSKIKNPALKTTPLLVEYDQLPESEKDYDRNTAIETIKVLLKLGYIVQGRRPDGDVDFAQIP